MSDTTIAPAWEIQLPATISEITDATICVDPIWSVAGDGDKLRIIPGHNFQPTPEQIARLDGQLSGSRWQRVQ